MKIDEKQNRSIAEPAMQYSSGPVNNDAILNGMETDANHGEYMTVSEYFDKVRKALDLRYKKLQGKNQ